MGDTTKNPQPDAIRAAFIADLEMVHDNLRAAFERVRDQCPEPGGDPFTEGRWEGSFVALRAVLVDELGPMLRAWQEGLQYSRKGEQLCGRDG